MKIKKYFVLILALTIGFVASGQVVPPPAPPPPPPGLPLDGGLVFLVFSAIIYGAKKIKN